MHNLVLTVDFSLLVIMIITSFLYYKKYKNTRIKWLSWFFLLSLFVEIFASILRLNGHYNVWLYNAYINFEYLFYIWFYYHYIEHKLYKRIVIIIIVIYETYFLVNWFYFSDNINSFQTYPFAFAQILSIIVLFTFIIQMISSDKIFHIQKYLIFWVALGLLFYYIVPLPLNVSENLLLHKNLSNEMLNYLRQIQYLGNILMYLLIIYGYIWSSKIYTSQ